MNKLIVLCLICTLLSFVELAPIPSDILTAESQTENLENEVTENYTTEFFEEELSTVDGMPKIQKYALLVAPKVCPPGQSLTSKKQCRRKYQ
jgi:hypothetical protein